jgi:NADPH-dependent 7-cyano-7-deazaguanine reductase QueF-like protein
MGQNLQTKEKNHFDNFMLLKVERSNEFSKKTNKEIDTLFVNGSCCWYICESSWVAVSEISGRWF